MSSICAFEKHEVLKMPDYPQTVLSGSLPTSSCNLSIEKDVESQVLPRMKFVRALTRGWSEVTICMPVDP